MEVKRPNRLIKESVKIHPLLLRGGKSLPWKWVLKLNPILLAAEEQLGPIAKWGWQPSKEPGEYVTLTLTLKSLK